MTNNNMPTSEELEISHTQSLAHAGLMVLMDDVSNESIKPVIEWILHENYVNKKRKNELLLMICSAGGDVAPAFALIDVMKSSKLPIKTVGLGQIASAGLLIFLSGSPGRRVLTANTSILSHQFSWGSDGKAHELFATIKEFELLQRRMVSHYKSCTGLDEDKIREKLLPPHDVWLTAEEALELGVCDVINPIQR